jgi:spore coat protein H
MVFLAVAGLPRVTPLASSADAGTMTGDDFFDIGRVWKVHLRFSADQFAAMEPAAGFGGSSEDSGGGPPAPPGLGGRGGPPGPGGFGFGGILAERLLAEADTGGDGGVSSSTWMALGRRLCEDWAQAGNGRATRQAVESSIDAILRPPGVSPSGGAGDGGPGRGGSGPDGDPTGSRGGGRGGPSFVAQEGRRNGMSGVSGIDFPTVHADLAFENQEFPNVTIRYKGNNSFMASRNSLKRSMKVDLNDASPGRTLAGVTKFNLHSNVTDPSWMNEVLSYRLFREAGVPAGRTAFAQVYLTVPGQYARKYVGLYSIVENVDSRFARERFGTKKGAIFKPVAQSPFEDLGDRWSDYSQVYDAKTPVSAEESKRVIAFAKLVTHATDAEFAAQVADFLDIDEFARFMAVTVWLSNMDSLLGMGQNYVVYLHPKTRQFQFLPWDLDHSFGQFMGGPEGSRQLDIRHPWNGEIRFLDRVFGLDRFMTLYIGYLRQFNETICAPDRVSGLVDDLARVLRSAVREESPEKLASFERAVSGTQAHGRGPASGERRAGGLLPPGPGGGGGSIKTFVGPRVASVRAQLAGQLPLAFDSSGGGRRDIGPPGGPGGPDGGPGAALGGALFEALDADHDGVLTRAETERAFARWFAAWDRDQSGLLSVDEVAAGFESVFGGE